MTDVPSWMRSVRSPTAASQLIANGACPCWWRHGWKWSEMKAESSPTSSACAAYVTRSRGPNCSADAFQPTLSTLTPSGRGGVVPPAYGRALSSPSPVHDDLVADAHLVVQLDQQRLVAHVDAAVRRPGVAEPGEVRGVVDRLSAGEEHGVRHGRVVEVRDDVDLLVVDGEDTFAGGELVAAEADVEAVLRHAVDDPGEHLRRLADAHDPTRHAALVEVPRDGVGLGQRRLRHDVGELVARGRVRHGDEPVPGLFVDGAGGRETALGLEAVHRGGGRRPVAVVDVALEPGDLTQPCLQGTHLRAGVTGSQHDHGRWHGLR